MWRTNIRTSLGLGAIPVRAIIHGFGYAKNVGFVMCQQVKNAIFLMGHDNNMSVLGSDEWPKFIDYK